MKIITFTFRYNNLCPSSTFFTQFYIPWHLIFFRRIVFSFDSVPTRIANFSRYVHLSFEHQQLLVYCRFHLFILNMSRKRQVNGRDGDFGKTVKAVPYGTGPYPAGSGHLLRYHRKDVPKLRTHDPGTQIGCFTAHCRCISCITGLPGGAHRPKGTEPLKKAAFVF